MRSFIKVTVTALLATLSVPCLAGRINGVILEMQQQEINGVPALLVRTSGLEVPLAACHTGSVTRMFVDLRSDNGRAMASLAYLAFATGDAVRINGIGACTVHPEFETADFFIVNK